MDAATLTNLFVRKNLPTDYPFWQKLAGNVVTALRERNAAERFVAEAQALAESFDELLGPEPPALIQFGELALLFADRIAGYDGEPDAPEPVRDVYELAATSIALKNFKSRFEPAFENVRRQLEAAEDTRRELEDYLDDLSTGLDEANAALDDFRDAVIDSCRPK